MTGESQGEETEERAARCEEDEVKRSKGERGCIGRNGTLCALRQYIFYFYTLDI